MNREATKHECVKQTDYPVTTFSEHPLVALWDSYNQELVSQVHPPDWENPAPAPRYNLAVIGSGTAGRGASSGLGTVYAHRLAGKGCDLNRAELKHLRVPGDLISTNTKIIIELVI